MTLICTKTFRAHLHQRFRYASNGQTYALTQTKRGKTTVWHLSSLRPSKADPKVLHEVWLKCDADESAAAINDLATWYGKMDCFTQFFQARASN
jgi:hypothetical protein